MIKKILILTYVNKSVLFLYVQKKEEEGFWRENSNMFW